MTFPNLNQSCCDRIFCSSVHSYERHRIPILFVLTLKCWSIFFLLFLHFTPPSSVFDESLLWIDKHQAEMDDDEDRVGGKKSRRENQVRMKFHASFYFQSQLNSIASWVHVHQNEDHLLRICLNWVSIAPHSLVERQKRARNEIIDQVFGRCVWQLFWRLRAHQLHSVLTQKLSFSPHYYFHSSDLLAREKDLSFDRFFLTTLHV